MESRRALIALPQQSNDRFKRPRLEQYNDPLSSTQHSTYGEPMPLHLARKVFISHSGCDKPFVRWLYKDLCSGYHGIGVAFFDEKTLPKGEFVSMVNILEEAKSSKVGVLVLTDDFFMNTPNPMLELEAFVDGEVKLLPLFFSMSVNEFKEKQRRDMWEEKWREWAAKDNSLVIDKWRSHLDVVSKVCGLEYCMTATNWGDFIDIVLKEVIRIVGPTTPFCDIEVHGMARMCKVVNYVYGRCASKCSPFVDCTSTQVASTSANSGCGEDVGYKIDVVAIYGFPGLGKTTLCQCLCDFYYGDFHGNVFYIELGSSCTSRRSRMEHVLRRLSTSQNNDSYSISRLNDKQVENMLKNRFCSVKDPVFLAIDNISPDMESLEEADFYMSCEFRKGSKVFITSRSEKILTNLTNQHSYKFSVEIRYMLELKLDEARDIFEQEFPDLREARLTNLPKEGKLESDVDAVVKMCIIHRERYHPLMLKSLAAFVRWDTLMPNLDWKGRLANLAEEGMVHKDDALEKVFQVFDKTYALLTQEERKVFLDLALFQRVNDYLFPYEWIQMVHSKPGKERHMEKILLRLRNLGFIEREWRSLRIQDLCLDYGKHRADVESDQYVVAEDGDAWPDEYEYIPTSARHVSVSRCREASRMVLDLRGVERMQVLHLLGNIGRQEVLLMHSTCAHLRSLIVSVPEGAELLFSHDTENWTGPCFNLVKCVKLLGNIKFCVTSPQDKSLMSPQMDPGSMFLCGLRNLEFLELVALPSAGQILDLTLFARLKELVMQDIAGVKSIRGPENQSQLCIVKIKSLPHLQELATSTASDAKITIDHCDSLEKLVLGCRTRSSSWCAAVGTESRPLPCVMDVNHCPRLTNVDGLSQYVVLEASFGIGDASELGDIPHKFLTDMFGEMVKDAGLDSSLCKAVVERLTFDRRDDSVGLACIRDLCLLEAQHIGMFVTALFKAQPRNLQSLEITCQQGGNCGCDQYAPLFGPGLFGLLRLQYSCPKVKDLASISNCRLLYTLILSGCTAVEIWPDFSYMIFLKELDLSNTSLKEWPTGLLHVRTLDLLLVKGCQQLPAKEMIFKAILYQVYELVASHRTKEGIVLGSLCGLRDDLMEGRRERSTVADALEALSLEIGAVFDQWSPSSPPSKIQKKVLHAVIELMYRACFGSYWVSDFEQELHMAARMKGLLCSGSFLSLAYRACRDMCWYYKKKWIQDHRGSWRSIRMGWFPDTGLCLMGVALVGKARILGACYNAAPALNDVDADRDAIIIHRDKLLWNLKRSMWDAEIRSACAEEASALLKRVKEVVSTTSMESGKDIMDTISEAWFS